MKKKSMRRAGMAMLLCGLLLAISSPAANAQTEVPSPYPLVVPLVDCVEPLAPWVFQTTLVSQDNINLVVADPVPDFPDDSILIVDPGGPNEARGCTAKVNNTTISRSRNALGCLLAGVHSPGEVVRIEVKSATAHFGYYNTSATDLAIPRGIITQNFFAPGKVTHPGQPNLFKPGVNHRVFSVTFSTSVHSGAITWFLGGSVLTATANLHPSLFCRNQPNWRGAWDFGTAYSANDAVNFGGSSWIARRSSTGTQPTEGEDWDLLALRGEQGLQGLAGSKGDRGDMGATGPQGPAGSQGSVGPVGPQGPAGATGPQGPTGPLGTGGNQNTFSSTQTYTFPRNGKITITDSHVTASSVIYVQYVGGWIVPPVVTTAKAGEFIVLGLPNKKFRYVIFN